MSLKCSYTGWRATGNASIWTVKDGAIVGINDEKISGLPPFGIPVATLGIRLSLLHIRLVLCSPVPSVVALGCNSFCRCPSSVGHPAG